MLIAAIDPDAEAELDGLNKAVVSGPYLKENTGVIAGVQLPVLASSASGVLFVGNAATAAVRGRRRELGVLAAGLLAAAIAVPISAGLGLSAAPQPGSPGICPSGCWLSPLPP